MTYPEMKDSGIPYIGEIPSHWRITKTLHCLSMPITDGPHTTPELYDSGVPFISAEAVSCGNGKIDFSHMRGYISEDFYEECCKKYVPQIDDIYMIKSGATTGRVAIVDTDRIFTIWSPLAAFRANRKRVLPKFLFYALQSDSYQKQVELGWTYGTQQNIGMRTLETLKVCLPPLDEQVTIVAYLDRQFSVIDSIIDEAKASIEEYKRWKASVIYQAVTKGLDLNAPMKDSGVSCIGTIPLAAKISRVNFHYDIILGKMLCSFPPDDSYTLEPYYCAANVHFEGIASDELKEMWFNEAEKERYLVKCGDLLVVEGGAGAGGCAIAGETIRSAYIQNSIMIVRPKGKQDIRYLRYLIEMLVNRGYMEYACNKATIPHFTKEKLAAVPYPLFNENDVVKISDYLDKKCAEIDAIISEKQSLIAELEAYKKSLIYEAVTGKRKVG